MASQTLPEGIETPLLADMEQAHTQRFLTQCFTAYYRQAKLDLPPRFNHREWGFIPWGRSMRRHLTFTSRRSLKDHLHHAHPAHAYHSVAYYRKPSAAKMVDKVWQGADLVFDLDADHMEAAEGTPFPRLMEQTLVETNRLVHEFLLGDLGLEPRWLKVYFSGGRGYHIHVRDPRLLKLDSHGRREIVDYITSTGLDLDKVLVNRVKTWTRYKGKEHPQVIKVLPSPDSPGWGGRLSRTVQAYMRVLGDPKRLDSLPQLMQIKGVGPKTVEKLTKLVKKGAKLQQVWEAAPSALRDHWLEQAVADSRGHTDEPVTTDTHRLIRLPGSLHGGTGLAVVPVPLEGMQDFDPYQQAVVLDDRPVKVRAGPRPGKVTLRGEAYGLEPSEVAELPTFAAVYFLCRKWATLALSAREEA